MTTTEERQKVLDTVVQARALIGPKFNWTQETLARDQNGYACDPRGAKAVCWCASGAIEHVAWAPDEDDSGAPVAARAIGEVDRFIIEAKLARSKDRLMPDSLKGTTWVNDVDGHDAILDVLDRFIEEYEVEPDE